MKHTEEAIDKVLAGLRSVEPPTGMERRLLLKLEAQVAAPVHGNRVGWRTAKWMLASALMLMVVIAIAVSHPHRQLVRETLVKPSAASIRVTESPRTAPSQIAKRVRAQAVYTRATERRELASQSFPAPPMPLTEQERLLLLVAHSGDPVELTMLDPDVLELEQEQRKRDFLAFFPPPSVLTQPTPGDNK